MPGWRFGKFIASGLPLQPCPCVDVAGEQPPPDCPGCNPGTAPREVQVVLPALTNFIDCANCADYAGTYIVPYVETPPGCGIFPNATEGCYWHLPLTPTGANCYDCLMVEKLSAVAGGGLSVYIGTAALTPNEFIVWTANGLGEDCSTWNNLSVPYVNQIGFACENPTAQPAIVTAL